MNGNAKAWIRELDRFHFSQMGRAPLLSPHEERAYSRKFHEATRELRELVLGSPVAVHQVMLWAQLLRSGELSVAEILPRGENTRPRRAALTKRLLAIRPSIEHAEKAIRPLLSILTRRRLSDKRRIATEAALRRRFLRLGSRVAKLNISKLLCKPCCHFPVLLIQPWDDES